MTPVIQKLDQTEQAPFEETKLELSPSNAQIYQKYRMEPVLQDFYATFETTSLVQLIHQKKLVPEAIRLRSKSRWLRAQQNIEQKRATGYPP